MSRDQKIGLALGILLIGAVAAFFYRHEEPTGVTLPELKSAAELDQQISNRPRTPYSEPRSESPRAPVKAPLEPLHPLPLDSETGLVPEPIAVLPRAGEAASTQFASSTTRGANDRGWDARGFAPALSEGRTHTVQRGDTLSSIAARYLGSANRFQDVFDANRDRLRDANDLRIGQELRIPDSGASRAGLDSRTPSPTTPSSPIQPPAAGPQTQPSNPDGGGPLKFVPYPGGRTVPARTATPAAPDATPAAGGKRLSQVAPEDVIIRR